MHLLYFANDLFLKIKSLHVEAGEGRKYKQAVDILMVRKSFMLVVLSLLNFSFCENLQKLFSLSSSSLEIIYFDLKKKYYQYLSHNIYKKKLAHNKTAFYRYYSWLFST